MSLAPGARLGAYEILGPLGAGGMGEVYRARDPRLGRIVAVKVLPSAVASDPDRLARFEREARAVAGLNHPNIVTLHSVEDAGGVRFLTMELVEGETLSTLATQGNLSLGRIVEIAIALTNAMAAAHGAGIIHRDLKPGNIMVTGDGRIKVLDFGLAKAIRDDDTSGAGATRTAPLTAAGEAIGTAPYMAPEQLRGEPADARTDLFSLGVTVYELATGRRPFVGASIATVTSSILRDTPTPLTALRPDLPPSLEQFLVKCLEKSPGARYQSASEARAALLALQRASEAASGAAPGDGASIAVLPFANMSADPENEYFSDGLSEELLNVLAQIPDLKVTGRTSSFAFKGKQEDLRQIGQKLGVSTLLEGSVRRAGNRVRITAQLIKVSDGFHLWSETYDRILDDIFAVQDEIARSVSAALHVRLLGQSKSATRATGESYELVLRGNHFFVQNTPSALAKAIELYTQAIEKNPRDASAWAGLSKAHAFRVGYYGDPGGSRRLARNAAERALALDARSAEAHSVMSLIYGYMEFQWDAAIAEIREAMALSPGSSEAMTVMSQFLGITGRVDEGLVLAKRAQDLDPLNPNVLANRARLEHWADNLEAARDAHLRTLELAPGMTAQHGALGLIYVRLGKRDEGFAEIAKERSIGYRAFYGAVAHHLVGEREESDAGLAQVLELGDPWAFQVAEIYASRGERDQAFHWLDRAYELRDAGIPVVRISRLNESLHSDPRWPEFLKKVGLG